MNLKKILLSSVAAVTLTSVAALAADNGPVALAADQTGDYLVFPAYYANTAGWTTNLKVVNTNTTNAIVAKVVIREFKSSAEKLDFPIYLSPGDVWEGILSNEGGKVYVTSTDDSMFVGTTDGATSTIKVALYDAGANQQNDFGYVEVFGVAEINATNITSTWKEGTNLAKADIRTRFLADLNGKSTATGTPQWREVENNALYGQEVIVAEADRLAMTLMATALENVTGTGPITAEIIAKDTTLVNSSNIAQDVVFSEIENALKKYHVYTTYYDASEASAAPTVLMLTQPMKKYRYGYTVVAANNVLPAVGYKLTAVTPTQTYNLTDYTFQYSALARNQKEVSSTPPTGDFSGGTASSKPTCNFEVCYITVNDALVGTTFAKGYVDYNLAQASTSYPSMPVIPTVMTWKVTTGGAVANIIYPAYKTGTTHAVPNTTNPL